MRKRAERGHDPGDGQHQLGPLATGDVVDGEHDGRETVKRDHNHDEARGIESNHSRYNTVSFRVQTNFKKSAKFRLLFN